MIQILLNIFVFSLLCVRLTLCSPPAPLWARSPSQEPGATTGTLPRVGKSGLEPVRLCISSRFLGETAAAGLGAPLDKLCFICLGVVLLSHYWE